MLFFVAVCLAASLIFAGRIVTAGDRAPLYAVAFATFILLLGLGMTPLPGGSGEAFVSRLINVLLASAYAIGALSLLERWRVTDERSGRRRHRRRPGSIELELPPSEGFQPPAGFDLSVDAARPIHPELRGCIARLEAARLRG